MPGDGSWLPNGEGAVVDGLDMGDAQALLEFLGAGNIPSPELCEEIAWAIRFGRLVGVPRVEPVLSDFARQKDDRDRWLGAWLWARRICIEGETLDSAIAEAKAKGAAISEATMRRASAAFIKRVTGGDFDQVFGATGALRHWVLDICGELGLDRAEMLSRIEPLQKLEAIFATAK
jgi:hypothetical protein